MMWTSVADLVTPTSLFFFLNLTIAAIALTSRTKNNHHHHHLDSDQQDRRHDHHHDHHHSRLNRVPSLLERARSVNFSLYNLQSLTSSSSSDAAPAAAAVDVQSPHLPHRQDSDSSLPTTPSTIERASSLLDRMKSINNYFSSPDVQSPHRQNSDSSLPTTPTALERASSLLDRMKSINNYFSSPLSRSASPDLELDSDSNSNSNPAPASDTKIGDHGGDGDHHHRSQSEAGIVIGEGEREDRAEEMGGRRNRAKMTKSASEKCVAVEDEEGEGGREWLERRRPATVRLQKAVSIGDDHGGVDSKADDFINRFKQQLKLQRLDSLLRNRELLKPKVQAQQRRQLQRS